MASSPITPEVDLTSTGQPCSIESFGEYVVRHLNLRTTTAAVHLAAAAAEYLRGDVRGLESALPESSRSEEQALRFQEALVAELDAFSTSYLAFHWHHMALVLEAMAESGTASSARDGRRLRYLVAAATRGRRFQRAMDELRTKRAFSTLLEELKAIGMGGGGGGAVAEDRSPVLLLVGGGMGAGKSTAVAEMLRRDDGFWTRAVSGAVVVEADAFKESDVVYRAIVARGNAGDAAVVSQVVHDASTRAAASLLVAALNTGRDVIFDGTMSWQPFVEQTVAMARDVHRRRYRVGPGYVPGVTEEYWVVEDEADAAESQYQRRPYHVELVGVVCDPLLAVVRGVRRCAATGRSVPVEGQLRSHKMFATAVERYVDLVDGARIYSTDSTPPRLIAWKDVAGVGLVDEGGGIDAIRRVASLHPDAPSIHELYGGDGSSWAWQNIVLSPQRAPRQQLLREMLTDLRSYSHNDPNRTAGHAPALHHSSSAAF